MKQDETRSLILASVKLMTSSRSSVMCLQDVRCCPWLWSSATAQVRCRARSRTDDASSPRGPALAYYPDWVPEEMHDIAERLTEAASEGRLDLTRLWSGSPASRSAAACSPDPGS